MAQLRLPVDAISGRVTFRTGWIVLMLLLAGFFILDPFGVPASALVAAGADLLLAIAARGQVIETR
jgi:arsenical pump membrane protein